MVVVAGEACRRSIVTCVRRRGCGRAVDGRVPPAISQRQALAEAAHAGYRCGATVRTAVIGRVANGYGRRRACLANVEGLRSIRSRVVDVVTPLRSRDRTISCGGDMHCSA